MSDKIIRVLHITEMLSAAGIESFIMNMYRRIDRSKIQFDFLVLRDQEEFYDEEIKKLGGKKYFVHSNISNTWLRILDETRKIRKFLDKHSYDIVHIHYTTPLRAPYLLAAKSAGVTTRIYHAHSAAVSGKSKLKLMIYGYYRKKIALWGTDWFGCSEAAAEWIFPKNLIDEKKVKVVYNGIDIDRFKYDERKRLSTRAMLELSKNFVLIHTGRFIDQKNHGFVLDIFKEVKSKCPSAKLILLGTGNLMQSIQSKAEKLGLKKDVLFLGVKNNVEDYLCAADCYVMPSLYEGLPVAAVEAECSGLPCIMSTNITREVALTKNVKFVCLNEPATRWADEILKSQQIDRVDASRIVEQKGYSVKEVAKELQEFYISRMKCKR